MWSSSLLISLLLSNIADSEKLLQLFISGDAYPTHMVNFFIENGVGVVVRALLISPVLRSWKIGRGTHGIKKVVRQRHV